MKAIKANVWIEQIYFALPAKSISDISAKTGLSLWQVIYAIAYLRRHAKQYGWTIPHVRRGLPNDEFKYHCALLNKNDKFETDAGAEGAVLAGHLHTLQAWATQAENQAIALRSMAANHMHDPYTKKVMRGMAGDAEHMASQVKHLIELLSA